jgi:biopolymer transport protein ExbB
MDEPEDLPGSPLRLKTLGLIGFAELTGTTGKKFHRDLAEMGCPDHSGDSVFFALFGTVKTGDWGIFDMTFIEYMNAGGSIMWIILFVSLISAAVAFERLIFFMGASTDPRALEEAFARTVPDPNAGPVPGASSMHRMFAAARDNWHIDDESMKTLLEGQLRRELYRWGKNLSILEVAAKVSPLLGLLGTVLGMVEMFRTMNLGGAVNSAAVTGGIWKALFTTVAGLTVAIPVIIVHGFLSRRIDREEETLRRGADFIMRERVGGRS